MGSFMHNRQSKSDYFTAICGYLVVFLVATLAGGCSFIFDFNECESTADCVTFDEPDDGAFFVCSNAKKCVLEVERECREDAHCSSSTAGPICQAESGKCVAEN